jgi:hypothetical protein
MKIKIGLISKLILAIMSAISVPAHSICMLVCTCVDVMNPWSFEKWVQVSCSVSNPPPNPNAFNGTFCAGQGVMPNGTITTIQGTWQSCHYPAVS